MNTRHARRGLVAGSLAALRAIALHLVTVLAGWAGQAAAGEAGPATVVQLTITGPIGPATSDYVARGLGQAAADGAALVILRLDTPGGLDTSMREIIKAILAAPLPVAGFVAPRGAHAASAGTFILYACHVAAMAPGTNLGAATPVAIGGPEGQPSPKPPEGEAPSPRDGPPLPDVRDKAASDAAAYIRSLAQLRGRNVAWAEKAVIEAASLSAADALAIGVVDLIAEDTDALLRALDGRTVTVAGQPHRIETGSVTLTAIEPDWRTHFLGIVTNPNVAAILLLVGVYGVLFEFYSPGLVGPGVIGAICLLLALYAFHILPVSWGGVSLILLGIALLVAEAFVPSFGVLGLGGITAFVIGAILLIEDDAPGFGVAWQLIGGSAVAFALTFGLLSTLVMRARARPVVTGREQLMGQTARVLDWSADEGWVQLAGERWRARGPSALAPGMHVRVTGVDGLTLAVEAVSPSS
ncbi:MAG: nodulation protein NfeD [Defluviicoccus sp.]|nr:nodulation protein NfeD [Defluviicoccus sp.]MDG4608070.1 nodulation protein NfeD [Defluviicoccus sp.]